MFEVKGLEQFTAAVDAWLLATEQHIADVARGIAVETFDTMLRISPQYSGDFVANWNVSVDQPDESFRQFRTFQDSHKAPFIGGDAEAQAEAKLRNRGRADGFTLGQTIYITNASVHAGDYYAGLIEDNQIKFRPGNAGAVIANTVQIMASKSHALSSSEAQQLAAERF